MPPGTRRRRWIAHYSRTEQVSLPTSCVNTRPVWQTALSRSPQITLEETPASQAILPTLLKQEQHVCQLFARLPDWTAPALTPATRNRHKEPHNDQSSTFTSAVVQHSRQHDADFRPCLVRKDSAPHQQLKPEQIKLADDIHLASSGWPQAQW